MFIAICFFGAIFIGVGVVGTLVFQGGEATGRLVQHARNLREACDEANEYKAQIERLKALLKEERAEYETWWARMAAAQDKLVVECDRLATALRSDGRHATRVATWLALDGALQELHGNPDPHCVTCGDSIGRPDPFCFVCGMQHDRDLVLEPTIQA